MLMRALATLILAGAATTAHADSVWIAGTTLSDNSVSGYAGTTLPLTSAHRLSDGWQHSVVIDFTQYEYDKNGVDITGRAPGLKYALGHEFQTRAGFLRLSLGGRMTSTGLSPQDLDNRNRGSSTRALAEVQWRSNEASNWQSLGFMEYVVGSRQSNVFAFVGRRLDNGLAIGPRVASAGNPTYRTHSLSLALSGWSVASAKASLHLGAQHREGGDTGPEVGFNLSFYRAD